jgi:hypothetical protein
MPDRVIVTESDRNMLERWLGGMGLPFTVSVTSGKRRSVGQNRLQRLWCNEIAEQRGDMTHEEVRAEIKLHHGVPILRAENEAFCEAYDKAVKPQSVEIKLMYMSEPLDFPVTRLMTVKQKSAYLDAVYRYYTAQGFRLTAPDEQGMASTNSGAGP